MRTLATAVLLLLAGCVSASSNLARLQAECSVAPAAALASSFIPVPGVGGGVNLALTEVCANTALIANNEAAIAAAIQALTHKP